MRVRSPTYRPQGGREQRRSEPSWRKWYKTARWQALRQAVFLRDLYTCKACGRVDGDTSKLACDHIEPHRGSERLFWNQDNLQTLCISPCHNEKKQREEQSSLHQRGVWY